MWMELLSCILGGGGGGGGGGGHAVMILITDNLSHFTKSTQHPEAVCSLV